MFTLLKNCRIVSPGVDIAEGAILLHDATIVRIAAGRIDAPAGASVIDAAGMTAVPGFIDSHCHGRNNFDFCDGIAANSQTILTNKLAEGVTTMLPTTLTLPEADLADALNAISSCDLSQTCRVPGVHLEGPFVNPKNLGAQNPDFVRLPDAHLVQRLHEIFPVRKITFAVEQPGGAEFTAQMLAMGIVPSCTHSAAKYTEFRAAYEAGLRNLSHFCNQMSPLHHRDIGLVGAGLLHKEVFTELICDKLHISPPMIQLVFQVKGCDHVVLITDAMRAAGMPDGESSLGGLPVIVKNGEARLKEGGALAGSTLQLSKAFRNVAEVTGLPLSEVVKASSASAAASLSLSYLGKLEPGFLADIVLLDQDFNVCRTMVGGETRFLK